MSAVDRLEADYPWIQTPLIACAPMRLIALAPLAVETSRAGGLGFIGAGSDVADLSTHLQEAQRLLRSSSLPTRDGTLQVGVGFLLWGADLANTLEVLAQYKPAAAWFFAPRALPDMVTWTRRVREATQGATKIWIQVGNVENAVEVVRECRPDVLVVQGSDAGGHGLEKGAGIVSLFPEVADALDAEFGSGDGGLPLLVAAGGVSEGRGVAASVVLGAAGVVMGTRYLAAHEANLSKGYREEVLRAADGGQTTVRSGVYDILRGTIDWPPGYGGRGVVNQSYHDAIAGMDTDENRRLYAEAMKSGDAGWGVKGRMTTYAGTGIGLVKKAMSAREITEEVRNDANKILSRAGDRP